MKGDDIAQRLLRFAVQAPDRFGKNRQNAIMSSHCTVRLAHIPSFHFDCLFHIL
jgi:hypothetical protein